MLERIDANLRDLARRRGRSGEPNIAKLAPYPRSMSVKVDLDQLADALADFAVAYLITVGDDFHAHTVAVDPAFADRVFYVGPIGKTTRNNVGRHPDVTLLWPPLQPGGYSLIVDGCGTARDESGALTITPSRAVLHRPAAAVGLLHDCVPLEDG